MGMIMQYDLATNFDESLIDFVVKNDTKKQIKSVFGKLKADITGGGRASFLLPEVDMPKLESYVKKCNDAGIEFNYLLNPITLSDSMVNPFKNAALASFIDELYRIGVRSFTVNSPLLCKNIKKRYSDVRITSGLYAYPTSLQMIQYWISNGADEITLDHAFNRDIPLLRSALTAFKDSGVKLRLIANNFCLHGCASKLDHACNLACASVAGQMGGTMVDYHLLNCVYNKVSKPAAMLCSDWIRPEDVKLYTQLMEETGNSNLTLKLVERTRTTEFLERVVKAYLEERFEGNLLSLLNWSNLNEMAFRQSPQGGPGGDAAMQAAAMKGAPPMGAGAPPMGAGGPPMGAGGPPMGAGGPPMGAGAPPMGAGGPPMGAGGPPMGAGKPPYKIELLQKYGRSMVYPEISIDNRKLDGFAEFFFNGADCRNKICGANMVPGDSKDPSVCHYCSNWAKKAVEHKNKQEVENWLAAASEVLEAVETREIYNV